MANVPLKTIKFPGLPDTYVVESGDPSLGITGATPGQIPVVKSVDENGNPTEWETTAAPVTSINGKTGAVELNASDVGAVSKDDITQQLGTSEDKVPSEKAVADAIANAGGGDMLKATYDPDGTVAEAGGISKFVSENGGKIDTISVNGTELPITDKTVDITIPTDNKDLKNGAGYITEEALNGYAKSTEIPTKTSQLENDSKFITEDGIPVKSVDGETGEVQTHAVKTTAQELSDAEKQQARENIGAGTSDFDGSYNSLTDKPEAYKLPVASEEALGGVKAIPKTDEMTAQVGVDENGALWYKPGSGGTGETPTADQVLFTKDLVLTEQFGRYVPVDGQVTVPAENISVQAVILDAFSQDKNPTITQPSVSVSSSTAKAYEVGTSVTPAYSGTLNPGSYEYKPKPTGVVAQSWSATNNVTSEQIAEQSGTFAAYAVPDGANYRITLSCTYSDGEIPLTALDKEYPAGQIKGGTKSVVTSAITGYRNSFYGTTTDKEATTDSAVIRGLAQKSNRAYTNGSTFSVTIPVGALRVIIAYPATLRDVTSIKDVNGLNADITTAFTQATVEVEGAASYLSIPYKVYTLDFATPNDTKNTYNVTI